MTMLSRHDSWPNTATCWKVRVMPSDAVAGLQLEQRSPSEFDAPGIGVKEPGYDVEQRGLASAVRADQPMNPRDGYNKARAN